MKGKNKNKNKETNRTNGTNGTNGGSPLPSSSMPIPELPPGITVQLTPSKKTSSSSTPFELAKLSLPLTLNEYYTPYLKNIPDCIIFLERFADDHDSIDRLVKAYKQSPITDKPDLDAIAEQADLSKGEFRRLINSTIDLLCDEEAVMMLRLSKTHIIKKSIEIALDESNEYSYQERKSLLEYYGFRALPKGSGLSINVNNSPTNNNVDNSKTLSVGTANLQIVNGLPSFSERALSNETLVSEHMKEVINTKYSNEDSDEETRQLPSSSAEILTMRERERETEEEELSVAELLKQ